MPEKVKRLTPKPETLRELFLKSGNQCAFPGCSRLMMNGDGDFVGQICHIEAAETGGERSNPQMTNEARRSIKNLMLMCYEHHVVTNNVTKYPVPVLQKMKKEHEAKFTLVEKKMLKAIEDQTKAITPGGGCNDDGVFCDFTTEPVGQLAANCQAEVLVARSGNGLFGYGLRYEYGAGGGGFFPSVWGEAFASQAEARQAALQELAERLGRGAGADKRRAELLRQVKGAATQRTLFD